MSVPNAKKKKEERKHMHKQGVDGTVTDRPLLTEATRLGLTRLPSGMQQAGLPQWSQAAWDQWGLVTPHRLLNLVTSSFPHQ